jgi:hypothetical protein
MHILSAGGHGVVAHLGNDDSAEDTSSIQPEARVRNAPPPVYLPADTVLCAIHRELGVALNTVAAGGYVRLQAHLEGNCWLRITDYAGNVIPLQQRRMMERCGVPVGWHVAIHPSKPMGHPAAADPLVWLASVTHEAATVDRLPVLIETALNSLQRNELHHIDRAGRHRVTVGILNWS